MLKSIVPGTFDPITNGHLDIIERASKLCDKVVVAVAKSDSKHPLFSLEKRVELAKEVCAHISNVEVKPLTGLLVHFAQDENANCLIKGLRGETDFSYEFQMALVNKNVAPEIESLYIMSNHKSMFISSSSVRELAQFGGDVGTFVPKCVENALKEII